MNERLKMYKMAKEPGFSETEIELEIEYDGEETPTSWMQGDFQLASMYPSRNLPMSSVNMNVN